MRWLHLGVEPTEADQNPLDSPIVGMQKGLYNAALARFWCVDKAGASSDNRKVIPPGRRTLLPIVVETVFENLRPYARGKVRDLYSLGEDLLLVATDRISAFDHVLAFRHPGKRSSADAAFSVLVRFFSRRAVANHLITADVDHYPAALQPYLDELRGRSMLVHGRRDVSCGMCCPRIPFRVRAGKTTPLQERFVVFPCPPACENQKSWRTQFSLRQARARAVSTTRISPSARWPRSSGRMKRRSYAG